MSSSNLDIRNHSALMKRAEQLKRWEESDTNKESPHPKPEKSRKIRFPSGCVFLASCLSGDKNEVVTLLEDGADINTANVDGLTALHQVIIETKLRIFKQFVYSKLFHSIALVSLLFWFYTLLHLLEASADAIRRDRFNVSFFQIALEFLLVLLWSWIRVEIAATWSDAITMQSSRRKLGWIRSVWVFGTGWMLCFALITR